MGIFENDAKLEYEYKRSEKLISDVAISMKQEWTAKPSKVVRLVLGNWIISSMRHLLAIHTLCKKNDLYLVSEVHYRQMLEILIQVRFFPEFRNKNFEENAQYVHSWSCMEYKKQMETISSLSLVKDNNIQEVNEVLQNLNPDIVSDVKRKIYKEKNRQYYWFGHSFSSIAKKVNRKSENLDLLYHLTSIECHGSIDTLLNVSSSKPNQLNFKGYSDSDTLKKWIIEQINLATYFYKETWNEIAKIVGAPKVI